MAANMSHKDAARVWTFWEWQPALICEGVSRKGSGDQRRGTVNAKKGYRAPWLNTWNSSLCAEGGAALVGMVAKEVVS